MALNGKQIKVVIPEHLQSRLDHDAEQVGVPVASVVRMILASHYELLATQQEVRQADTPPDLEMRRAGGRELPGLDGLAKAA